MSIIPTRLSHIEKRARQRRAKAPKPATQSIGIAPWLQACIESTQQRLSAAAPAVNRGLPYSARAGAPGDTAIPNARPAPTESAEDMNRRLMGAVARLHGTRTTSWPTLR